MPILFDARTVAPHYPGVGRYGQGLLAALAQACGDEVTLLQYANNTTLLPTELKTFTLSTDLRSLLDQALTPTRLAGHFRPSEFIYHSPFYIYPYSIPHRTVVTLYDITPLTHPMGFSSTQRWLYDLLHRIAVSRARRVITLSNTARADLVQRFRIPSHKIAVIPPGHLPPSRSHREASPRDTPTPPPPYLLYVGINKPHKNLPRLVEAYARLGPVAPPLLLVGPIDSRFPQTSQTIERLGLTGRVRWLGRVSDEELAALYANATLVTIPSLAEGFGFPVLEAMALGAPVACSDIPVLRELAEDAALYFDPLNVETMAATIERALTDSELREAMRQRGLARGAGLTWARAAEATRRVYEECAS